MGEQLVLQEKLRKAIDQELSERVSVHRKNIARLQSAQEGVRTLAAPVGNRPLVLLAEGDSWFDYPLVGNGPLLGDTDVIAHLRNIGAMPPTVLNLAVAGSTAVGEMSLTRQSALIAQLQDKSNWFHGKPDAILFSAGGNDIAGESFCIFLDFNDGKAAGLNTTRFSRALGMVEACYLNLFAIRDRVAPGVPVFGHCYDFPIPNGKHPLCVGPWLKPSLDYCNWSVGKGTAIVHEALTEFRTMLKGLEANPKNKFHLVDTQGTLDAEEWANELHPTPKGF
ncbi:SGNH/GDSL hydrolase family protein [Rhizobium rhizosphaerae]|uniref:SGNH/GDSL hydrolase family protein n=1 Tax=Xaviernesmea rhizosphaerae TaxID=1672749 RepID=A0ABX3P783_9HYPH|nr:SGNH/GDSL hydrolase family protein [Xaviernesmea rhizosphaerae]OQP83334.1 SGNH/GDSL hydrolase family protein [Xaviernesmea rhizosphaerae]